MSHERTLLGLMTQLNPDIYGFTHPTSLDVQTETVLDGDRWRLCVTGVTSYIHAESWLPFGEREATKESSTEDNFCKQVEDLHGLDLRRGAQWYMIEASRKHEAEHVADWKVSFATHWPDLKTGIEAMRLPKNFAGLEIDKDMATEMLRNSKRFKELTDVSHEGGNFPTFWDPTHPDARMRAIEKSVVEPRIKELCQNAKDKGWKGSAGPDEGATECVICPAYGVR